MLNLAFIGPAAEAALYKTVINRIDGANWFAYAPLDEGDFAQAENPLGVAVQEKSLPSLLRYYGDDIDALIIHAPSGQLKDLVNLAIQAAKPTLVASLLVRNIEEFTALSEQLEQGLLVPAWPWRFIPAIQAVKTSIDSDKLGDPGFVRMHHWNSKMAGNTIDIRDRIIPAIDLVMWFFAAQPKTVYALKSPTGNGYLQLHLQFENNGMALIDDTGALPNGGDYFSLTVIGSRGAAYADDHRNINLLVNGVYPHAIRVGQGVVHIVWQLQEFVDIVRYKRTPAIKKRDILRVLQVSDAVLESIAINKIAIWQGGKYECY